MHEENEDDLHVRCDDMSILCVMTCLCHVSGTQTYELDIPLDSQLHADEVHFIRAFADETLPLWNAHQQTQVLQLHVSRA